jgi:hypothetical protein
MNEDALAPYLEYIQYNEERLKRSDRSLEEKQREQRALRELLQWARRQNAAELRRRMPVEVYLDLKEAREQRERQEAQRQAAIDALEFLTQNGKAAVRSFP